MNDIIKKQILNKIERAKNNVDTNVKPKAKERLQRFRADKELYEKKLPNLTAYSFTDTSVMSAVERMTASLMKMVFGNSDIGSIKGRNADDDQNAQTMQELCNWQVEYANAGYQKFYWWIKECLYQLYSVVMVTQKREYEDVEEEQLVPIEAAEMFQEQAEANEIEILEEPTFEVDQSTGQGFYRVKVKYRKLTANYPLIENVPSEELIWIPAKTLNESELVGRRKQVTIDYLVRNIKKKQKDGTVTGMYDKAAVMELAKNGTNSYENDSIETTRNGNDSDAETYDVDDPNRKVTIVECFAKADLNGDNMLEDCIITVVEDGNVFIRMEENEDGFPFCIISPVFDPYRIVPDISGIDALGQWQDLLTAIIRLTVENLALNNNPQMLCQSSAFMDFNQVLDGDRYVELNTPPGEAMAPAAEIPLASYTLQLIEMVKGWGEEASNVNRYNQGIDSNSLNKTATGITALINQGSQALELIMRNIAETGLKSLYMRMIYLNQKYIDQDQVVRLTNKDLVVNKDNLKGDFDFIVEAGMGAGAKETDVQNMLTVLQMMPTDVQTGLATLKNAFNAKKKYYELIGIRNTSDYLTDPETAQPQSPQKEEPRESITVSFKDLPRKAKAQYLQKHDFDITEEDLVNEEIASMQIQAKVEAQKAQMNSQLKQQEMVLNGQTRQNAGNNQQGGISQGVPGLP